MIADTAPDEFVGHERRRLLIGRTLLYAAPVVLALTTVSALLLIGSAAPAWGRVGNLLAVINGILAAVLSAAGAACLPNGLAVRVVHGIAAGIVSPAVYVVLVSAVAGAAGIVL